MNRNSGSGMDGPGLGLLAAFPLTAAARGIGLPWFPALAESMPLSAGGVASGILLTVGMGAIVLLVLLGLCRLRTRRREQETQRLQQKLNDEGRAREEEQAFTGRLINLQEQERQRIAREMHDGVGQNLLLIKHLAALGVIECPADSTVVKKFNDIAEMATKAISEVRQITYGLRPEELDHLGLTKAIVAAVNQASESASVWLNLDIDAIDGLLAPELEINLYRVVQEGMNNILKHAEASCAWITIKKEPGSICLTVRDDGRGLVNGAQQGHGFGFSSMHERIRILRGSLVVSSTVGGGTTLRARIPVASTTQDPRLTNQPSRTPERETPATVSGPPPATKASPRSIPALMESEYSPPIKK